MAKKNKNAEAPVNPSDNQMEKYSVKTNSKKINKKTKDFMGKNVIVHIKVYEDRTFDWVCLGQPVDDLIREAIKIEKGSGKPNVDKVGKITRAQLEEIANKKMDQLNANDIEGAIKIVAGTARSMGVEVVD